jgi:hypothetical protein
MGIFGNSSQNRAERGAEIANKVASGKGFYGRVTKAFVGGEDFARIQQSVGAMNNLGRVQQFLAAGVPTIAGAVQQIVDTGKLVNYDPVVNLVVQPNDGGNQIALQAIVSKVQVPRIGDQVLLMADPQQPGNHLYVGMA